MKLAIACLSLALPVSGLAASCLSLTASNIAANDGCSVALGNEDTVTMDNFSFTVGSVTAPLGFSATDNLITVSTGLADGGYPDFVVADMGDALWNLTSGQWSFTLNYSFIVAGPNIITDYWPSEQEVFVTGTGGSSVAETVNGVTSIASSSDPNPPHLHGFFYMATVTDVVVNSAGSGTSDLGSVSNTFALPEPSTGVLVSAALAWVLWRVRSAKFDRNHVAHVLERRAKVILLRRSQL